MATVSKDNKVHFYVSPFQRTLQTASWVANIYNTCFFFRRLFVLKPHIFFGSEARNIIFSNFDPSQVVHVSVDPRIREQEFGNLQGQWALELGGLRMVTPIFYMSDRIFVEFWVMIKYDKHENPRWIQSLWKY